MEQSPILIAGAGPTGLTLAIELARRHIPYRLIDQLTEPTTQSRALGIHARTLEVFADLGIIDQVLQRGHKMQTMTVFARRRQLAQLHYDRVTSPYPFAIILPQAETEALLTQRLQELGGQVERGLRLTDFTHNGKTVVATIQDVNGQQETMHVSYLVGCDGAHSTTRHRLDLPFTGDATDENWILADVTINPSSTRRSFGLFLDPQGVLLLIPMGQNEYRLAASHRAVGVQPQEEPTVAEFQTLADHYLPERLHIESASWLSTFRIQYRHVANYQQDHVFLAGDAAHIHSPAGGQGMNTGIQDAYNLGWKLAQVMRDNMSPMLLASYSQERIPVALNVLKETRALTRLVTLRHSIAQKLRNWLMSFITRFGFVQTGIVDRMSEIGLHYRPSHIIREDWRGHTGVKTGHRAPTPELAQGVNHVLLAFLFTSDADVLAPVQQRYAELIDIQIITDDERLQNIYHANTDCFYFIRPDGYIAYRNQPANVQQLLVFLSNYFV
jgi:2-polyprenyl-6-methoxyphenol hydroxylase-like FAD-dependent oxidoreductase